VVKVLRVAIKFILDSRFRGNDSFATLNLGTLYLFFDFFWIIFYDVIMARLARVVVPCCNFWSGEKLGRDELIEAIEGYYTGHGVRFERVTFPFRGAKNIGLVSEPPER